MSTFQHLTHARIYFGRALYDDSACENFEGAMDLAHEVKFPKNRTFDRNPRYCTGCMEILRAREVLQHTRKQETMVLENVSKILSKTFSKTIVTQFNRQSTLVKLLPILDMEDDKKDKWK